MYIKVSYVEVLRAIKQRYAPKLNALLSHNKNNHYFRTLEVLKIFLKCPLNPRRTLLGLLAHEVKGTILHNTEHYLPSDTISHTKSNEPPVSTV
jgi:hypothetical protein